MAHPRGESASDAVRLDFDRRLMLQFRGSLVTSGGARSGSSPIASAQYISASFRPFPLWRLRSGPCSTPVNPKYSGAVFRSFPPGPEYLDA